MESYYEWMRDHIAIEANVRERNGSHCELEIKLVFRDDFKDRVGEILSETTVYIDKK
jgi:hypothetical protein